MYKGHVAFEYEIQLVFLNKKLRFVLPIAVPYNKKNNLFTRDSVLITYTS